MEQILTAMGVGFIFYLIFPVQAKEMAVFFARLILRFVCMIIVAIGTVMELGRRRRINRGEIPFELPFAYRFSGWQLGGPSPGEYGWRTGMLHDSKRNRIVPIARRNDAIVPTMLGQ